MRKGVFAWFLLILFLVAGLIVQVLYAEFKPYMDLSLYSIGLFFFLTNAVQILAPRLASHTNRQLFLAATVYHTVTKMITSAILLYWYYTTQKPEDGSFVLPFIYIYLVFTTFETWFLMKTSYLNSKIQQQQTSGDNG